MRFPLYNPSINNIFSWGHEYCKGSWVQHMLRYIEGDTANTPGIFFRAMRVYGDSFKYKNASTEDYKRIHEQVTGLDLDWFFDEWVYQAGYPKYYYDWWSEALTNPNQYRIITQISQNNGNLAPTVFHMPLQIRFTTTNLDTIVTIPITTSPQTDTFYFAYQPTSMTLDPNNWILKKTFLGIQEEDYKPLSVDRGLLKIYPNPAKSAVNIRYSLPVKGKISLKLYDASGKLVKTLIDQNKNAGIHTLKIENPLRSCLSEASSKLKISNGVYFIELATPIQKYTRKILLIE